MTRKPKVFIASPLFNKPQVEIIHRIESMLAASGFEFYSARMHSGSADMTPEQRKDPKAWDPIMASNLRGLDECEAMIAVVEYAMPKGHNLCLHRSAELGKSDKPLRVELPDAGTIWEMGYHRAQGKPIVAFHSIKQPDQLNLMLSHGICGVVTGWDDLAQFIQGPSAKSGNPEGNYWNWQLFNHDRYPSIHRVCHLPHFDWSVARTWSKDVE
jgi:nucleoside 2-deoxyribosyltransferase